MIMAKSMLKIEFEKRKEDIKESLLELVEAELRITEWDVPEADEQKAKKMILEILQEKLDEIKRELNK